MPAARGQSMKLQRAFEVVRGDVVAFIGAGGKTSLMVGLGYELAEAGWRVLATTTTQLSQDQLGLFPCAMSSRADAPAISQALNDYQFVLLHDQVYGGRVYGPTVEWTRQLLDSVDSDILLVEADDAAGLPFKAPTADEPQVPLETSLVVSVASLSAVGAPLDSEHIYNPQAMIDRFGFVSNSPVKSPWLAQVLRDDELGLRGVPEDARVVVYLNQTPERGFLRGRARMIARLSLQSERISAVSLGEVRGVEPVYELQRAVGALVLAAGDSSRRADNIMLRQRDKGKTALAQVTEKLMRARFDHIRVISGYCAGDVRAEATRLGLKAVHNRSYVSGGLISSIKTGLRALPAHVSAALIVPGDQADIQPRVIYHVLSAYARGDGEFIVSRYHNHIGYPILIGRRHWPEILKMPRQCELSQIIEHFKPEVAYLDFDRDGILRDPERATQYNAIRDRAGL